MASRPFMARWSVISIAAASLLTQGCGINPFISASEFVEMEAALLDSDGDGDTDETDCNDENPAVFNGAEEIPYDGLDNDCSGGDVLDIDGDGYPGILKADWEAQGIDEANVSWGTLPEDRVDCRDNPAEDPFAGSIYPDNPVDRAYDGVDSNCDGENDYDLDRDGYMLDEIPLPAGGFEDAQTLFEAYIAEWGYTDIEPLFGDCDDEDPSISPGNSADDDVWYDGVDSDCAGNNDFDQDGDGYMPEYGTVDGDSFLVLGGPYRDFLDRFHDGEEPEDWNGSSDMVDCVDAADEVRAPGFAPEAIYPGADDIHYDGVDANCDGTNDFDQDDDGTMPDTASPEGASYSVAVRVGFEQFTLNWGYAFAEHLPEPVFGDCDDLDASRSPLMAEILGDGLDQDCLFTDHVDESGFGVGDYTWTSPRSPELTWNGRHLVLGVLADEQYLDGSLLTSEIVQLFFFDLDALANQTLPEHLVPIGGSFGGAAQKKLGSVLDLEADEDGATWVAKAQRQWGIDDSDEYCVDEPTDPFCRTYLDVTQVEYDLGYESYTVGDFYSSNQSSYYLPTDIDLLVDQYGPFVGACGHAPEDEDFDGDGFEDGAVPVLHALRGVESGEGGESAASSLQGTEELFIGYSGIEAVPASCLFSEAGLPSNNEAPLAVCSSSHCENYLFDADSRDSEITAFSPDAPSWFPEYPSDLLGFDRDGYGVTEAELVVIIDDDGVVIHDLLSGAILADVSGDYASAAATYYDGQLYVALTMALDERREFIMMMYADMTGGDAFVDVAESLVLATEGYVPTDVGILALPHDSAEGSGVLGVAMTAEPAIDAVAGEDMVGWAFWHLP